MFRKINCLKSNSSPKKESTDSAIKIGKSSQNSRIASHTSGVLPSIFNVAATALQLGGSNSSNNANNSTSATSGGSASNKDHNNNLIKRGGTSSAVTSTNELNFKDYKAPIYNEQLNSHNSLTFKLVKTGRSFSIFFLLVLMCTLCNKII